MAEDRIYHPKPKHEEGFKEPVSWLGGRELISSLKGTMIYTLYGENIDPRVWMKPNVLPFDGQTDKEVNAYWQREAAKQWEWKRENFKRWKDPDLDVFLQEKKAEFWFDYIADSGDGQLGVYGVACLCLSDLWLSEEGGGREERHVRTASA